LKVCSCSCGEYAEGLQRSFLIGLGLERYAEVFERNEIELSDLEMLSDTDLQGLGIEALGPRRRILGAIAARRSSVAVGADPLAAAGTFVAARAPSAAASGAVDALSAGGTAFVPSTASSGSGSAAVKATGLSAGTKAWQVHGAEGAGSRLDGLSLPRFGGHPRTREDARGVVPMARRKRRQFTVRDVRSPWLSPPREVVTLAG
jgi:hypothetical protein